METLANILNLKNSAIPMNPVRNVVESTDSVDWTINNGDSSETSDRSILEDGSVQSSNTSLTDDGSGEDPDRYDQPSHGSGRTAVSINPSSRLSGFVLYGVQGSKRLHPARTRMAQIDTRIHKDDDSFFDEMAIEYKRLHGGVRYLFSI